MTIKANAFNNCRELRTVIFEADSHLESIGESCFYVCGLREIVVPRSVRVVGSWAFCFCQDFSSFSVEPGAKIYYIGKSAFFGTQLKRGSVQYPSTLKTDGSEYGP